MNQQVIKAVRDIYQLGGTAALVTLCATSGSTPRKAGAKMVVYPSGEIVGTIGGGELEHQSMRKALTVLKTKKPLLWETALNDAGMVCGGAGVIYIEPIF